MILSEIGTHAYHLLRYVTELEVKEVGCRGKYSFKRIDC